MLLRQPITFHGLFLVFFLGLLIFLPKESAVPRAPAQAVSLRESIRQESKWILECVRPDGAIALTPERSRIQPYFANLAARALLVSKTEHASVVRNWMIWYLAHLNRPDRWGLQGSIYDFEVDAAGKNVPTLNYDSSDSYAATFLSLAWSYFEVTKDSEFINAQLSSLMLVASAIRGTMASKGLTAAKPDYPIFYAMDNAEVWKGLKDFAELLGAIGKRKDSKDVGALSKQVERAIQKELWNESAKNFLVHQHGATDEKLSFYPHATAQLWPIVQGLPLAKKNARVLWKYFAQKNPDWFQMKVDPFPWTALAIAGLEAGEILAIDDYLKFLDARLKQSRLWPWHVGESAGLILALVKRESIR